MTNAVNASEDAGCWERMSVQSQRSTTTGEWKWQWLTQIHDIGRTGISVFRGLAFQAPARTTGERLDQKRGQTGHRKEKRAKEVEERFLGRHANEICIATLQKGDYSQLVDIRQLLFTQNLAQFFPLRRRGWPIARWFPQLADSHTAH